MKKGILVLLICLLLVSPMLSVLSCTKSEEWAKSHIHYVHDDVHKVGIWFIDSKGKFGGRHIFVLPDDEYSNPGEPWPLK